MLDPMAGVGKSGVPGLVHSELEPEWAAQCPSPRLVANAVALPFKDASFEAVITSASFGNRMADHHHARDKSLRHTYKHRLGRDPHPDNTGAMHWDRGEAYRQTHRRIWAEVARVLEPGGMLVLNIKDHVRKGELQPVSAWHVCTLRGLGFNLEGWGAPRSESRLGTPG